MLDTLFGRNRSDTNDARAAFEQAEQAAAVADAEATDARHAFEAAPDDQTGLARMVADQRAANASKHANECRARLQAAERAEHQRHLDGLVATARDNSHEVQLCSELAAMAFRLEQLVSAAEQSERARFDAGRAAAAYAREHDLAVPELGRQHVSLQQRAQAEVTRALRAKGYSASRASWLAWNPLH